MRFAAKEDIAAPIDAVYAVLSDLEAFEKLALRKGVDLRRGEAGSEPGGRWDLRFRLRGRQRHVKVTLLALQPTSGMRFSGQSPNLDLTLAVSLIDLSRQRTRISVELVIDLLARGYTKEQVIEQYDHVTADDIQACLAYASETLKSERVFVQP